MKPPDTPLPPRSAEVLHLIVQSYIETGEPVASRTIARKRKDHLSPATIRNIMADLADLGYLAQPHTSAGRVPTEKAFRHYSRSLGAGRILEGELANLRNELAGMASTEDRMERTSRLLSEMTRNLSIVATIPASSQTLDEIELVLLPDMRILMVVVTQDHLIRNQVVKLEEPVTSDELASIRNFVNRTFSGWDLSSIRGELARRLQSESAQYDNLQRKLILLYHKGLLDIGMQPKVHMDGASNLVGLDLHVTKERLRELFRTLEEKRLLLELLDRFVSANSDEVAVHVGLGGLDPAWRELSLIGLNVSAPGGLSTRMAVLGPMRMNYPRVISAVFHVGQTLQSLPR